MKFMNKHRRHWAWRYYQKRKVGIEQHFMPALKADVAEVAAAGGVLKPPCSLLQTRESIWNQARPSRTVLSPQSRL